MHGLLTAGVVRLPPRDYNVIQDGPRHVSPAIRDDAVVPESPKALDDENSLYNVAEEPPLEPAMAETVQEDWRLHLLHLLA
jgi:hypothetical protein